MSAKPKTKSYAKLAQIEFCKGLDRRAAQIAAYRRIPLVEAYPEALRQIDREAASVANSATVLSSHPLLDQV